MAASDPAPSPRRKRPWWLRWTLRVLLLAVAVIGAANAWVLSSARGRIFSQPEEISPHAVALVLGTSKSSPGGGPNRYFRSRMDAAAALFAAGKVKHLLLSGDNGTRGYNEPEDMREALTARGVPDSAITLDFAGFRTLDSIVRARDVFGVKRLVIVSDDFHLPRALFLADHFGLDASGFAGTPTAWDVSWKVRCREALARVKMLADIHLLRTQPKFRGEKIALPVVAE